MNLLSIYDENTVIGYGKHKFKSLKNIPAQYFLNVIKDQSFKDKSLLIYILDNLEEIEARLDHSELNNDLCKKISFDEQGANNRLKAISKVQQKHKKPVRAYLCPKCELWHLTSKL